MVNALDSSRVYTDFQGLNTLKAEAREGAPEALTVAAKQFEAYLVQQLLRASRDANPEGGVIGEQGGDLYHDMFDKQVALNVTAGRGLGVAELLVRQLEGAAGAQAPTPAGTTAPVSAPQPAPVQAPPAAAAPVVTPASVPAQSKPRAASAPRAAVATSGASDKAMALPLALYAATEEAGTSPTPSRFTSGAEFVKAVMPHARRVAAELGVDPRVLVAQAALETGWGRSIIRNADGTSSHNLFNIKAHRAWSGPVATVRTREYLNGAATMVRDAFRSYDSFEASFRDYVDFLRTNPRYRQALGQTHDPASFARSLQAAGYATDPGYANKILRIFGDERLAGTLA
jgi:flagellar protein FlgJ